MKFKDTTYGDLTGQVYKGNINVNGLKLTSLEGAPKEVLGEFRCGNNKLTTLKYSPIFVDGDFYCPYNKLTTLIGAPEIVTGGFKCYDNKLTSLEGVPKEIGDSFNGMDNPYPYLNEEYIIRTERPNMSEEDIINELYKITNDDIFLPSVVKDIFLF